MEEGRACTLKGAIIPHVVRVSTAVKSGRKKSSGVRSSLASALDSI